MIQPFGLRDVLLVRRLQRENAPLAIEHILTHPQSPLTIALTAPWPWAGVGVATYVLKETSEDRRLIGFVQLMRRASRPEADLLHLAPPLSPGTREHTSAEAIWKKLLTHCCAAAAGHGLQRVYASIPDGGPEETCIREAGFSLYTREAIYRLAGLSPEQVAEFARPPARPAAPGFRPQQPQDSWALQRLYSRSTPRLVRQAEGALSGEAGSPPLSWWEPDSWQGIAWEPAGEVRGAVQVHIGRAGHWLRIVGTNELAAAELRGLVEQGLRAIAQSRSYWQRQKSLPIYVTVRDYEIGLSGALTGFGFAPYLNRARFVKHTLAGVREPALAPLPALETRQEVPVHFQFHRAGRGAMPLPVTRKRDRHTSDATTTYY